ncbi:3-oxoacyl-[acyl-carrier protein] reductase [Raoultella sp. BIGb0138]|uniref:SDR family NAD(P)-dependent oxidoreductase n=1 Tax=Raoultella sp. BIGb0138 TaxID=2485115 RepID=UPI001052DB91|nr:SDR family oxidoreductase [Raoultella sp. BIGb0138]TCW09361.1 3-oxoacyl-[acyl-carrier protein] reductase [Raoultella sp. BIGb0138]
MTTAALSGKTALVIGGSRGIGAAIVAKLAADGAAVAFTWVTPSQHIAQRLAEFQQAGQNVQALQADSADPVALSDAVKRAATALGGLDILVYNAGMLKTGPIDDFSLADFDRMYAVNVRGPFVAVNAALAHLRRGGRIITTGSIAGEKAGAPGSTVYGLTKAAVARMVRGLAWDLAERGITVNDVQPGPVVSDMTPGTGDIGEWLRQANPQKRLGNPEEVANLVSWLAGPESSYVNGAGFKVDGGFTA